MRYSDRLLERPTSWFPETRKRRGGLEHQYESLLIAFRRQVSGKIVLDHYGINGKTAREYANIREYFGFILCEYQTLIDNLLDHFDSKFRDWYGIEQDKSERAYRRTTGYAAIPLWWAHKYGNYNHEYLQVTDGVTE